MTKKNDASSTPAIDTSPADGSTKTTLILPTDKGGVGKSTTARATIEVARQHLTTNSSYRVLAMDGDAENGQLLSYLGSRNEAGDLDPDQDPGRGVGYFDARSSRQRGILLDMAERQEELLVFDLPGGALSNMLQLTETLSARDMVEAHRACGRTVTVMLLITPLLASISSVLTALELFGPDANYVVVKNMASGLEEDFVLWQHGIRNRHGRHIGGRARAALEAANGRVLELPALSAGVYARIDALGLPFTEALTSPLLPLSQRLSCRRWLNAWSKQLDSIADWLALPADYRWAI